jgi:hypothetical protein
LHQDFKQLFHAVVQGDAVLGELLLDGHGRGVGELIAVKPYELFFLRF